MKTNNFKTYRSDLMIDASEIKDDYKKLLKETKRVVNGIEIIKHIVDDKTKDLVKKDIGTYYLIDFHNLNYHDSKTSEQIENCLSFVLRELLEQYNLVNKVALVIGLGNESVTPDALGPCAVDNIIVTRHLKSLNKLSPGYGNVSAIIPGVLGTTGIESFDIIDAIRERIKVDYIICIDSLATKSIARLNHTIQITDSGIAPGSGVGNKRKEISFKTQKIPVIAVGVPTVVDASCLVSETIDIIDKIKDDKISLGVMDNISISDKQKIFYDLLTENGYNMMVTSKDIDLEIEDLSKIVAWGINKTLHDAVR